MTGPLRRPAVGGIGGGVGTTLIAVLIDADDVGAIPADGSYPVDVLVARSTAASVKAAIGTAAQLPTPPVLVVVADSPGRWAAPVQQRLKMAQPNMTALLELDWISSLSGCDDPWSQLSTGIFETFPPKWAQQARDLRELLLEAVTPLVMRTPTPPGRPTPDSPGADSLSGDDEQLCEGIGDDRPTDPPVQARVS